VFISEHETKSVKDLQDAYNKLYKECLKQGEKLLSVSTRLKKSEDEKKALHVDLVKSKAHIVGLKEEKQSLYEKVSYLDREYNGLLESKKSLEFKLIKLSRDLHESQELLKRLSQSTVKLDKLLVIGKSVGDKSGTMRWGCPSEATLDVKEGLSIGRQTRKEASKYGIG
ncbi:unnamed protein product, partial [Ilex paraguariensis]